jgi:hypothetical protein
MAGMYSNFFKGQTDRALIHWPYNSGETWLSNQEEGEEIQADTDTVAV